MSGTPVIRMARQNLAGAGLKGFEGILNGTSNYVLGRMESGLDFSAAVSEAQQLGYAEADPTADVEGFDVRLKVVILANQLLHAGLTPDDVPCRGISKLTSADLDAARREGFRWKLVGSAAIHPDGVVRAEVSPRRLPLSHPLSTIGGATNAVSFNTALVGDVTVSGPGAGRVETAYALLADIIAIHRDMVSSKSNPSQEAA
jgi:homoserine dehydrogenase